MFSSISNNSDREDTQKETANSLHLKTVDDKLGHNGDKLPDKWVRIFGCWLFEDLSYLSLMLYLTTSHENIIEIPRPLALSQKKEANFPTTSKTHVQPGKLEEEGPNRRMEKLKVKESAQQRLVCPNQKVLNLEELCWCDRTQPDLYNPAEKTLNTLTFL